MNSDGTFTVEEHILFRYQWNISKENKQKLDFEKCFICSVEDFWDRFEEKTNPEKPWIDILKTTNHELGEPLERTEIPRVYFLSYIDCDYRYLDNISNPSNLLLLTMRVNFKNKLFQMLVRPRPLFMNEFQLSKYKIFPVSSNNETGQ